ncbi:MAG: PP2C family protein-serine/threonine phosphatase [Solirubrobacteraceae bacterium]
MSSSAELLSVRSPRLLPDLIVQVASRLAGSAVAMYVIDLDGSCAMRLAGDASRFPDCIVAPVGVGPEVVPGLLSLLRKHVLEAVPGSGFAPLIVRDRVMGFLLAGRAPAEPLDHFAGEAAVALELASGYTDALHFARRRKDTRPAAEIQQNLLPPRLACLDGVELAGGVLPGYEVGGDFFDYADNADGLWLAVADAAGKGNAAAALASLAIGSLRAARRAGAGLREQVCEVHEATLEVDDDRFLTGVFACWDARGSLRWINCGHPPPLVVRVDGRIEELDGEHTFPLGILERERSFTILSTQINPRERLLIYTDGLTERRRADGTLLGVDGLRDALAGLRDQPPAVIVRGLQDAVIAVSPEPLRDDTTMLVLAPAKR